MILNLNMIEPNNLVNRFLTLVLKYCSQANLHFVMFFPIFWPQPFTASYCIQTNVFDAKCLELSRTEKFSLQIHKIFVFQPETNGYF